MKKYKLPEEKEEHITAAGRRYFPEALQFCQIHNTDICKENGIIYEFDFFNCIVYIRNPWVKEWTTYHKMITCQ